MSVVWHFGRMRIVCPSCSAAYDVADSLLTPGRTVRCARCSEAWVARPVEPSTVDEPKSPDITPAPLTEPEPETPRPAAMDRLALGGPARSSGGVGLAVAWTVSVVVLVGLLAWGAYAWRAEIVASWPASARLYSLLGLAAPRP